MELFNFLPILFAFIILAVLAFVFVDFLLRKLPFKWCQIKYKSRHSMPSEDSNSHLTKRRRTTFLWDDPHNETVYNKLKIRVEAKKNNEQ